jgi:hypothetical protein
VASFQFSTASAGCRGMPLLSASAAEVLAVDLAVGAAVAAGRRASKGCAHRQREVKPSRHRQPDGLHFNEGGLHFT